MSIEITRICSCCGKPFTIKAADEESFRSAGLSRICADCLSGKKPTGETGTSDQIRSVPRNKEQVKQTINTKYRVHQVAKDFSLKAKHVVDILTQFDIPVKNHMVVLSKAELDIVFEYLVQHASKYAALANTAETGDSEKPCPAIRTKLPIAVIDWEDNGYYVAGIDPASLTREVLVETCANHALFFETYQEAVDEAQRISKSFIEIKMSAYPVPDLGAL